ncbi:hypothetical protein MKZ38_008183 [Zalerion maritima]|uniref:Uncharacterized protein n=1 Tax=Zalerion maritima TaxID=339359 RepID=A0AAD5RUC2_9PEZI|nr:hypothetical protein MKZ38_008183 [Zalerion maritima]
MFGVRRADVYERLHQEMNTARRVPGSWGPNTAKNSAGTVPIAAVQYSSTVHETGFILKTEACGVSDVKNTQEFPTGDWKKVGLMIDYDFRHLRKDGTEIVAV